MKTNITTIDRILRVLLGIALIALGYYYRSWWGLVGILPVATATLSFCPLYALLKINRAN